MKSVIRSDSGRPMLATVTYEGQDYLTSISDSTQMSQQVLKGYAASVGVENLPQVACKTVVDRTKQVVSTEHVDENGNPISIVVYGKKEEISAEDLLEVKNYTQRMKAAGKDNFVIPMMTTDSVGGSGHTIYMAVTKEEGLYKTTILNQSANMTQENKESTARFSKMISATITEQTGVAFHEDVKIITGAFPPEENVASCTEIGAKLLDAMMNSDPRKPSLSQVIASSRTTPLTLEDIARIRLTGMRRSNPAGISGLVNEASELAGAINGSAVSHEQALALQLGYEINDNIRDVTPDVLAIPLPAGRAQEITSDIIRRSNGRLTPPAAIVRQNIHTEVRGEPVVEKETASVKAKAASIIPEPAAVILGSNDDVRGMFQYMFPYYQDIINRSHQAMPIAKEWLTELVTKGEYEKAKNLLSGLDASVTKEYLGQEFYQAIRDQSIGDQDGLIKRMNDHIVKNAKLAKVLSVIESNTIIEILTKDGHTNLNEFVDALRKDPNKAAKDLLEGKVEKRTSAIIAKLLTGRKTDYDLAKEAIEQIKTSIRNPDAPLTKISRWSKNTQVTR